MRGKQFFELPGRLLVGCLGLLLASFCSLSAAIPSCNYTFGADFLYWELRSDQLPFAFDGTETNTVTNSAFERIERIQPQFRPGVRLSFDYLPSCFDGWDMGIEWVYLDALSKGSASGHLFPLWVDRELNMIATGADAQFETWFNLLDLTLSRLFCAGQRVILEPQIALCGAWINQQFLIRYDNVTATNVTGTIPFIQSKNTIDFWGYGIGLALKTRWAFCYGFSLLADTTLNLFWSKSDIKQKNELPLGVAQSSIKDSDVTSFTPLIKVFLGGSWTGCVCCHTVNCRLGWEEHYFFNLTQFNQFANALRPPQAIHNIGGMGLDGLTVGITVGF